MLQSWLVAKPVAKPDYTRQEVQRLLSLPTRDLRRWERMGLVPTCERFTFLDLLALHALLDLRKQRIPLAKIRLALTALRERLQDIRDPLRELRLVADSGRVHVLLNGQAMDARSGQLLLNFDAAEVNRLLAFPGKAKQAEAPGAQRRRKLDAEQWFERGVELEQKAAPLEEVVEAYQQAAALDPDSAAPLLNLGTVYFHARRWRDAECHYRKALDVYPEYALAHFNLANLYDEQGEQASALEHYRAALRIQPHYADAHYNLALLYQNSGDTLRAVSHWKAFLKLDANSSWATIARRELEKLRRQTVLEGTQGNRALC